MSTRATAPGGIKAAGVKRVRARLAGKVAKAAGSLTQSVMEQMDSVPGMRDLSAEARSYVGLILQRGIAAFAEWLREPDPKLLRRSGPFDVAPREMTGMVDLRQTVALERLTFRTLEDAIPDLAGPDDAVVMHEALLEYAREVAFSTAEVYARAAEMRGAWDARLEALVVDSVMQGPDAAQGLGDSGNSGDESLRTRASALGWDDAGDVLVALGSTPADADEELLQQVRRAARTAGFEALVDVQGDRLVVVLGGATDPDKAVASVVGHFGDGPVVTGPVVPSISAAYLSAKAAVAGLRAAPGWAEAPRPVAAGELLPERALSGDADARGELVQRLFLPLADVGVLDTVTAFLANGGSIEATSRALFVHANTVRYRLRRAQEATGLSPADPRHAYTFRVALTLGRLTSSAGSGL